jgi:integrase
MMVWQKGGNLWYCRVRGQGTAQRIVSTGTADREVAEDIEALAVRLRRRRRWELLAAILDGRPGYTLAEVYDADVRGTLDALERALADVDLEPFVAEWTGRGPRTGSEATRARYVRMVRELVPAGVPFPRSRFTRGTIAAWLDALPQSSGTRRAYRVALSNFARWLVQRDALAHNPVRDVDAPPPNPAREVWLSVEQALAAVAANADPVAQAVVALMHATGVEWQACERATRRDLDLAGWTFYARGTKTGARTRRVAVAGGKGFPAALAKALRPLRALLAAYAKPLHPSAPLFPTTERRALEAHTAACAAAKTPRATLHDTRHSVAVWWVQAQGDKQALRRQLGHRANSLMVERIYGVYTDRLGGEEQHDEAASATNPAPTREMEREA